MGKNKSAHLSFKDKAPERKYSGFGYVLANYLTSRNLYRFIWSLSKGLNLKGSEKERRKQRIRYHRFIGHVYVNRSLQSIDMDKYEKAQGFVPVSSRLIERTFKREFDVHILKAKGIIDIKGHDTAHKKSREFRIVPNIFDKAKSIELANTIQRLRDLANGNLSAEAVNLMTGRRKKAPMKSRLTIGTGGVRNTNMPQLIKRSINSLKPCPFNPKYVYKWLVGLERIYKSARQKYNQAKRKSNISGRELYMAKTAYQKAQGRYLNDERGIRTILNQNPKELRIKSMKGDPVFAYQAAYTPQGSGRISEIYGGFQSSSQYLKWLLFKDIQHLKKNYDMKSSQANILLQEFKACKLKCNWLESYLKNPDAKNKFADIVGIPADVWKQCFYAMIMGAEPENKFGTIFQSLKKCFKGRMEETLKAHKIFLKVVQELIDVTEKWRNYIYEAKDKRYYYKHKDIKYWKNACGLRFKHYGIAEDEDGNPILVDKRKNEEAVKSKRRIKKCKRQLAAFILQGREALFIHHLTIICSKKRIPVYRNEHDGIITGEEISKIIIRKAAQKAKLKELKLERKAICEKEKRKEEKRKILREN